MLSPVTARSVHPTCVNTVKVGSQKSVDQTHRKVGLFAAEKWFFLFHEECGPLWEWEKRAALRKEWPAARIDVPEEVQSSKERTDDDSVSHSPYGIRTPRDSTSNVYSTSTPTQQHYDGKNSTSCDKSNPKCCTVCKILLRDMWFFQYCDFCGCGSCNEFEDTGAYRKGKHTVTGTNSDGLSILSTPTR